MASNTLTPELLLHAYASGIFPMAETRDDPEVFWVDPKLRGILPLDGFHISRSLARRMRRGGYRAAINRDFAAVVSACADRDETWINETIFDLYQQLHGLGFAHSLEIWDQDRLAGGVYGVTLGGAFFGESMVSRTTDASKLALAHLVDHLRRTGFTLFDTQFITPHLATLGGQEITRARYHKLLLSALDRSAEFGAIPDPAPAQEVLQRMTQIS